MVETETRAHARRERFKRLAERRVVRAIRELRLVGNLSNKANYTYDKADAEKIIRALEAEVKALKGRFEAGGRGQDIEFKL
jgi:hypothetical protein